MRAPFILVQHLDLIGIAITKNTIASSQEGKRVFYILRISSRRPLMSSPTSYDIHKMDSRCIYYYCIVGISWMGVTSQHEDMSDGRRIMAPVRGRTRAVRWNDSFRVPSHRGCRPQWPCATLLTSVENAPIRNPITVYHAVQEKWILFQCTFKCGLV